MTGFRRIGPAPDPGSGRGVLVLARDPAGRLLLQLRDNRPEVVFPGFWSLFGGAVEPGESLRAAALREFREETGLSVAAPDLVPFAWFQSGSPRRTRLHVFRLRGYVSPRDVRLGEGAGFGFFDPADALALALVPGLRAVLEASCAQDAGQPETSTARPGPNRVMRSAPRSRAKGPSPK